jgi:PDZ domain
MKQILFLGISIIFLTTCTSSSNKGIKRNYTVNDSSIPGNAVPIVYADYVHLKVHIDTVRGIFLLDTGFDNLCLDSIFYSENRMDYINSSHGKIYGIGNAYQRLNLITDSIDFSFGNHSYRTSFVPVLNLKPIGGDFVDGLIGTKHFRQNVLEINYAKKFINIYETIDSVDISEYSILHLEKIETHYFVPVIVRINDTTIIKGNFLIDSASPESTLTSSAVFSYGLNEKVDRKVRYYTMYGGIGGESSGYDFSADSLEIAGFNLGNVILSYSLDSAGLLASEEYIGIMGNNILDRFDILFDFRNCNMYLKPNKNFNKPYHFDRLGFSYVDRCKTMGGWIVTGLYENSPAEKKGLRIDDKIVSVNDTPVEKISYETQKEYLEKLHRAKFVVSGETGVRTIRFKLAPLL